MAAHLIAVRGTALAPRRSDVRALRAKNILHCARGSTFSILDARNFFLFFRAM
jgi:hypothetical protein